VLVNAAGPWADRVARLITPAISVPALECVQGTHLVLPGTVERGIYYLESPHDGRAVFVMPWKGQLMVGTTETRYEGDPALVAPTAAETHYLLGVLKHYFPRWRAVAESDLIESFAGLRVLPAGPDRAFSRSRETQLIPDRPSKPRVLSIYGGKLTTWRAVSQRALGASQLRCRGVGRWHAPINCHLSPDTAAVLHVQQVEDDPETLGSQEIGGRAAQRGTPRR
jgi:glycerol-3-phosphate dehydrogenase